MEDNEYQKMYEMEGRYWWFIGRRKLVNEIIRSHVADKDAVLLDIGCGTGLNLLSFSRHCRVIGTDNAKEALAFCRQRGLTRVLACDARAIPLASSSVDVVTMLDVLEHIRDDMSALDELLRVVKPGGTVIIIVPAYGFLWSEHDEALHHYRRYVARELRAKLTASGFELERSTYYITLLFFPILLLRLWQGLTRTSLQPAVSYVMPPRWANLLLVRLLGIEQRVLRSMNLPFGVSLLAIGRKRATTTSRAQP
jgi:SAM-dependent methyltransferase